MSVFSDAYAAVITAFTDSDALAAAGVTDAHVVRHDTVIENDTTNAQDADLPLIDVLPADADVQNWHATSDTSSVEMGLSLEIYTERELVNPGTSHGNSDGLYDVWFGIFQALVTKGATLGNSNVTKWEFGPLTVIRPDEAYDEEFFAYHGVIDLTLTISIAHSTLIES